MLATAGAVSAAGPQPAAPRTAVVFSGPATGSRYTVRVVMDAGDEAGHERVRAAIDAERKLLDRLLSPENPESELARLNASASTEPLEVSAETLSVLLLARRASELSGGAFDATAGPLLEAWGPGPRGRSPRSPDEETLARARERVGYALLQLDGARRTVTKVRPDVTCDVSALAGGWVADRMADAVVALGHPDVLVDVGGEVASRGRRADGERWRVAVGSADGSRERGLVIELENAAVATARDEGDDRTHAGARSRRRTLDPRTGAPVGHELSSATVVHRDGAWAAAVAAALLVLGPDEGRVLAARERLAARLVLRRSDGTSVEWSTPQFDALIPLAR